MRNIVTHSRGGLLLVPLLLLVSVCCLLLLVRAGLWNGRGTPFGIAIPGAGLLLFGFATREALSAPSRTTIETDSRERVLRIGCETLVGPSRRVYPYDDICEVCVRPRSGRGGPVAHDLSIFTRAEGWSPPVAFAREAAARHVAARHVAGRLAAEIVAETDDPGERPPSYAVRIVTGDDAPWDAVGESGEPRHDTVFRSSDRKSVRSTAARLARRIGRPWRDATEPPAAAE